MGAGLMMLDTPNTEIEFAQGKHGKTRFVAAEMQGWRLNMVRSHLKLTFTFRKTHTSLICILMTTSSSSAFSTDTVAAKSPYSRRNI